MTQHSPVSQLIGLWPSASALAKDIGLKNVHVSNWARRGSIPSDWLWPITLAAWDRGIQISPNAVLAVNDEWSAVSEMSICVQANDLPSAAA